MAAEMGYRYDPLDLDCEAFSYAKSRAEVYYRNHKRRYNGDFDDLLQIARIGVVEAVNTLEEKDQIPESLLMDSVEDVLSAAVKRPPKQSSIPTTVGNGEDTTNFFYDSILQQPEYVVTPRMEEILQRFQHRVDKVLSPEHKDIIYSILLLGDSIEDKVAALNAKRVGKGNCRHDPVTIKLLKQRLADAIKRLRKKLKPEDIEEVAKLSIARELIK